MSTVNKKLLWQMALEFIALYVVMVVGMWVGEWIGNRIARR